MNNNSYIKRLTYAKYIYLNGVENLHKRTSISGAVAILMFHDASEQFLMIIADKLGFKIPFGYMGYWEEAKKKGKSLPNKNDMSRLNKLRVNFKHYGIIPTFNDCRNAQHKLLDFFITVSNDILDVDFNKVSLAELIEYEDVKIYLKKAEKLIQEGKHEDSIVESAKAFGLFEKRTEGDVWHSHILKEKPFGDLGTFEIMKIENKKISKAFSEAKNRLDSITKYVNVLILGIDSFEYQKFRLLSPVINITLGGKIYVHRTGDAFKNIFNFNEENAQFCINFVIDSVMRFQERSFGLFNRNKPHTIKIKNPKTKLFSYVDGVFKEIKTVDEGEIFESAKLTLVLEKRKDYWRVIYKEKEVFIELNDIEWIRETKQHM